jgi:SAM-dependent methyltransferase
MVDPERDIYGHSRDEEEEDFFRRLCVTASFLANKLVLDVGCGIGRLANRLSRVPSEVIGVELSSGVDKAWEEARCHPQAHFIQGNLYTLPFRPRVFDYIYSKGVLQYVYDSREAFRQISMLVAPGGGMSITLYPPLPRLFQLLNRMVRAITLRLPLSLVHLLGTLAVPFLSLAWRMSGVQERPISWSDRGHMIFNWLASDYQNFHSVKEVISWYREEGFGGIRSSAIPIGVFGQWEGNEP